MLAEAVGLSRQAVSKWSIGPLHLKPDCTGKAVRFISGGTSGGVVSILGGPTGMLFACASPMYGSRSEMGGCPLSPLPLYIKACLIPDREYLPG